MSVFIRNECDSDQSSIWKLNQLAFGGDDEAALVDALRDGEFVVVSLIASLDREVVGHILFSPLTILTDNGAVDAVSLAPMAVLPKCQQQGIGSKLVNAGLKACREQGHKIAVVLGHPQFYPRFGFCADLAQPLESPFGGGEAWMAMELVPGALNEISGSVRYSPPFGIFE